MEFNNLAKWIWADVELKKNSVVSFVTDFDCVEGDITLFLCAETDFIAYVNGKRVGFGQFAGYRDLKYIEQIDITDVCKPKGNTLKITVRYEGFDSFTHIDDGAGVIFTVEQNGKLLAYSNENVLSGVDNDYEQEEKKILSVQIGYSLGMVAKGITEYSRSCVLNRKCNFEHRPVKKLCVTEKVYAKKISQFIYDLSEETAGYLFIKVDCPTDCLVSVGYAEHIATGKVVSVIPGGYLDYGRDFSLDFNCVKGENYFEQFFVRIAGRYLQINCNENVIVKEIGLIPAEYPTEENGISLQGEDKRIYDIGIRTLKLCMHNHYEDCPWREQALYVLDSRNQMLCGYKAFKGHEYQREMLRFIAKGVRKDKMLELTYPAVNTPAIPFFSLMYVISVGEYIKHTEDYSILKDVFPTIKGIVENFYLKIDKDGLVENFDKPFWNFYEWSQGSNNENELIDNIPRVKKRELILNCALVYSLTFFKEMCRYLNVAYDFDEERIKIGIVKVFYDANKGLFFLSDKGEKIFSALGNAFACIIGLGNENIRDKLINGDKDIVPATLSMQCFVYDAVLQDAKGSDFIIKDIREKYGYMLRRGATSFWETIKGLDDEMGGSLCHGWSAMPVYYYHLLKEKGVKL